MRKILFSIIFLLSFVSLNSQDVSIQGNKFYVGSNEIWFNGINTPWHLFDDFGRSDFNQSWWEEEFAKYNANHINLARVWIHGSGEVSPNISSTGYVSGASDLFWEHMDILMQIAKDNKVYVMPALLSFDITKDTYTTYTYWRAWMQSESNVQSYIDNVLIPLVQRYDDEPYLLGWEICNEPEWMFENPEHGPQSFSDVQRMHAMFAAAVHENGSKPVTTGSAAPKWNSPIYDSWGDNEGNMFSDEALSASIGNSNAFLDFYQYHWYAWQSEWLASPYTQTTAEYEVDDRPVIVGESEGNDVCDSYVCMTVSEMYENAYLNGFDGVCAWKTPQNDGHGTFENIAVATNSFYENHPGLVCPIDTVIILVTGVELSGCPLIELSEKDEFPLTANVFPSNATDKSVTWSSSNTDVATVNSSGRVIATGIGIATITVTTNDGGFTQTCSISVTNTSVPVSGVSLSSSVLSFTYAGQEQTLSATVLPANASNKMVAWNSTDESVVTVSNTGVVTAISEGVATVTVTTEDGSFMDECNIEVAFSTEDCIPIALPYAQNGEGNFCLFTSDDISYINSWNAEEITINGSDFTNTWSNNMPAKVDGGYYITYVGLYGWSHFEVAALKSGRTIELSDITNVSIFPNPFTVSVNISIDKPENVKSILVLDNLGKIIEMYESEISPIMNIGETLSSGVYLLQVNTLKEVKTYLINKD